MLRPVYVQDLALAHLNTAKCNAAAAATSTTTAFDVSLNGQFVGLLQFRLSPRNERLEQDLLLPVAHHIKSE